MSPPRFLILPGWPEADAAQWCARWQARLPGAEPVQQDDTWWPRRGDWMARLDEHLLADDPAEGDGSGSPARPVVLVAHHLGCHLVARWASHSAHTGRVKAALLEAPVDIERPDLPPQLQAWAPILRQPLPFPSRVLPDARCSPAEGARLADLARSWASEWAAAGADDAAGEPDRDPAAGAHAALRALCRRAGLVAI